MHGRALDAWASLVLDNGVLPPLFATGSSDGEIAALRPTSVLEGDPLYNNASEACALQRALRGALARAYAGSPLADAPKSLRDGARFFACAWRTAGDGPHGATSLVGGVAQLAQCSHAADADAAASGGRSSGEAAAVQFARGMFDRLVGSERVG